MPTSNQPIWTDTTMRDADYSHLIRTNLITAAEERLASSGTRLSKATSDLEDADAGHQHALRTSERAVAGETDDSPLEAEHALHASQMKLNAARKVYDAAVAQQRKAVEGLKTATALAFVPVQVEGIRRRIAACAKAETARRMLAEAEVDFAAGTAVIGVALDRGTPDVYGKSSSAFGLTEAAERHLWESDGVDIEAGTTTWNPGPY